MLEHFLLIYLIPQAFIIGLVLGTYLTMRKYRLLEKRGPTMKKIEYQWQFYVLMGIAIMFAIVAVLLNIRILKDIAIAFIALFWYLTTFKVKGESNNG